MEPGIQRETQQKMDNCPKQVVRPHAPQPPIKQEIPKNYTGSIWMKKLVAQLIFYNLNRWQIRNEAAHASESAEEYENIRDRFKATITALYQMNAESDKTISIYRQPLEDILAMSNERLSNWLHSHTASMLYRASHPKINTHMNTLHTKQNGKNTFRLPTARSGPGYSNDILFSKDLLE